MASTFISSQEKANFARMCWIVVDVFRDILWHVLTDEISPADLANKVQINQSTLKKLNKDILFWLCNINAVSHVIPNSKDFEVTSLYTLIRNLCRMVPIPTNGWGRHPPPVGVNLGDDVEWVRVFRNAVYGHAKEGNVNTADYNILCRDMKTVVTSIDGFYGGNCDFVGRIDSILACSMDKALQDTYIDKMQEIANLSDDIAEMKQVVGGLSKDLEGHVSKAAAESSERRKTEDNLKRDIESIKGRVDSVEKDDIAEMKQVVGGLSKDLEGHVSKAAAESSERRKTEDTLKKDIESIKGRVDSVEKDDIAEMKQVVGGLSKDLEGHVSKAAAETSERRKTEDNLKRDIESIKGRVDCVEKESIEVKKQWDSLSKERQNTVINKTEQKRIIESSQRILEQHRSHAVKNFVETRAYRQATEILRQHRRLIITGKSGQGKSYMAHQLLYKISADDSYVKPLIISNVEQWKTLVDCSITFGIMVDDMCGKFCLDEGVLKKWMEESTYMPALIESGKHFVIFTMNSFYYEKILVALQSRPLFSTKIILNLDINRLNVEEKSDFANIYLKEFGLNNVEVSDLCKIHETPVGFPQLCKAAEMITKKSSLFDLFSKPREIILEQIKYILRNDSTTYGCLALVLLSGGKLNLKSVRELRDDFEKKENIPMSAFRFCGTSDVIPIHVIDKIKSLQGTFLSLDPSEGSYSFDHDSIEDAVFISYGEFFPEQTLKYCPLQLVCKRCTIKYDSKLLETTSQDNILILPPSYQAILINRFMTALRGGNPNDFAIVSEANIWSCNDFRKAFIAECSEIHVLADKDENSLLVHAANVNNRDLADELVHEFDHIPEAIKGKAANFLIKGAQSSCAHKDTYLLKKICENGRVDVKDILPNSIQHGSVNAIEFLLQSGADIDYKNKNGENLIHIACLHGRLDIVQFLHSKNANLVHEFDNDNRSVGLCVAAGGSVEILEYLLPLGLDSSYTDQTGWNLLHYACWGAKKAMAEHLVEKYPKLLSGETKEGFSVLSCAAFGGNIHIFNIMDELMKDSLNVDQNENEKETNAIRYLIRKTTNQETLLHISCLRGSLEMTKYLIQKYPTMLHEVDKYKRTPAHIAAHSGNVAVLSYLIDRGTYPWCRTSKEETLLHRACINGQLEMTKYLVKTYPTMLHMVDNGKRTPAHKAAESGNVAVLSYLIDRGTEPWSRTSKEETLLHRACINGQLEMTKYLVQSYPAMLHEVDNSRTTPAHNAAKSGDIPVLKYTIDCGTDPWCRTSAEETLLHRACINGQLEMTKYLVQTYPTMLLEVDNRNRTPTHKAAESGNVSVLSYLIDCGINPWCRTSEEETLLHRACINGQLEMTKYLVQTYPTMLLSVDNNKKTSAHIAAEGGCVAVLSYLIDRGTDPWCRSSKEETTLHRACINGQLEMTKYLVKTYPTMLHTVDNSKRTPAHNTAHSGNVSLLRYLIDHGADPTCRTTKKETLLHRACINGQLEMTKYLVQNYPTMLSEVDNSKRTVAHSAAASGIVSVLSYVIDRGTDPWSRTSKQETLLHRACINGQLEMTKYLVQNYPTMLNEVDNRKRTVAHSAAASGIVSVLSYVIDRGTDPWSRTSKQETLLHRACINGQLEMTKYLVQKYPTILHEVDNSNRTPAHSAAESGNVSLLSYLIDSGTDPWCRTSKDETLLHRSCINGQLEMTKYLLKTYPTMLDKVDHSKRTAAHSAAESGNLAVLSYLIDRGIDPWCRTSKNETLLHRSCINGQLEMTKYLVKTYPIMLPVVDNFKRTPAHKAAESGIVAVLNSVIDRDIDPWCRTSDNETLLHRACITGHLEMTKYLVQTYPTMLHEVDNSKRTAAHKAAESCNVALLSYLIDRGTNPWCRASKEETLLHRACINGQLEMTMYLVLNYPTMLHEVDSSKRTPAHKAAERGNVPVLSYLIDRGADAWCRTSKEETLLHRACINGQLEMTKYLVENYPTMLHEVDNSKRTPAYHASHSGNVAVLSYLIDRGTDPWSRNSKEETLLHRACNNGQLEMTKYLVQTFPTMLLTVDNRKRTPSYYAAHSGNADLLRYLSDSQQGDVSNLWLLRTNKEEK